MAKKILTCTRDEPDITYENFDSGRRKTLYRFIIYSLSFSVFSYFFAENSL